MSTYVCDADSCSSSHSFSFFRPSDLIRHCRDNHPTYIPQSVTFARCVSCLLPFTTAGISSHACCSQPLVANQPSPRSEVTVVSPSRAPLGARPSVEDPEPFSQPMDFTPLSDVGFASHGSDEGPVSHGSGASEAGVFDNLSKIVSAGSLSSPGPRSLVFDSPLSDRSHSLPSNAGLSPHPPLSVASDLGPHQEIVEDGGARDVPASPHQILNDVAGIEVSPAQAAIGPEDQPPNEQAPEVEPMPAVAPDPIPEPAPAVAPFQPRIPLALFAECPPLHRILPKDCRKRWIELLRPLLNSYFVAHTANDAIARSDALMKILLVPRKALQRLRGGRKRKKTQINRQINQVLARIRDGDDVCSPHRILRAPARSFNGPDASIRRANDLMDAGHVKRAAQSLSKPGSLKTPTQDVIDQLAVLHPQGPEITARPPDNPQFVPVIPDEEFVALIRSKLANGASPGPSGWTGDLLLHLTEDEECLRGIAAITEDIRNGVLSDADKDFILGSRLVAIPKGHDAVRPIAIGGAFYKLACLHALAPLTAAIRQTLSPWQLGVAVPGGAEIGAHQLQLLLEDPDRDFACLSLDISNAFNSRNRNIMLERLYACPLLEPLFLIADWAYSASSPLWIRDNSGPLIHTLRSSNGSRQGCPIAGLLWCISVDPLINEAILQAPTSTLVAFVDDSNACGPPDEVIAFARRVQVLGAREGLALNPSKYTFAYFHDTPLSADVQQFLDFHEIEVSTRGLTILGVPIGTCPEKIRELCKKVVDKHDRFFSSLGNVNLTSQRAFILLRLCGIPRMNFLARTVYPSRLAAAATNFDERMHARAMSLLHLSNSPISDVALSSLSLPIRFGGFGLRNSSMVSPYAFWGSFAQVAASFQRHPSANSAYMTELGLAHATIVDQMGGGLTFEFPPSAIAALASYTNVPVPGLQKCITAKAETHRRALLTEIFSDADKARVTSCSSKNAGAWLTALPSSEHGWTLSDEEFLIAARLRMGLPPHDRLPRICSCGVSRDDMPSHCLSCIPPAGASVTYRHDLVKNVLAYWARIAGAAVEIEPRNLFPGSNMRPDLLVHLGCTRYLIDNVISHPLAPSHLARAQRSLGTAAYAETRKRRAYGQLCAGIGASFVPFSCESFGAIGECASTFIKALCTHAAQFSPWTHAAFYRAVSFSIGVAIQQGNARIVAHSVQRAIV